MYNFGSGILASKNNLQRWPSMMKDEERIVKIHQAQTREELDQALNGYHEEIISADSNLQGNYPFNLALEKKLYFHALCDIKRAARGLRNGNYQEIIRVLESATDKQFVLGDL